MSASFIRYKYFDACKNNYIHEWQFYDSFMIYHDWSCLTFNIFNYHHIWRLSSLTLQELSNIKGLDCILRKLVVKNIPFHFFHNLKLCTALVMYFFASLLVNYIGNYLNFIVVNFFCYFCVIHVPLWSDMKLKINSTFELKISVFLLSKRD